MSTKRKLSVGASRGGAATVAVALVLALGWAAAPAAAPGLVATEQLDAAGGAVWEAVDGALAPSLRIDGSGLTVAAPEEGWELRAGAGGELVPVQVDGTMAALEHPCVSERFTLQAGAVLHELVVRAGCARGALARLRVAGARAVPAAAGTAVDLFAGSGAGFAVLRYGELRAVDALGAALAVRLVDGGSGALEVRLDDAAAVELPVSVAARLTRHAWSAPARAPVRAAAWGDVDGDGDLELALGVDGGASRLYAATGGGLVRSWTAPFVDATAAVAWGDRDGDGDVDLALGNGSGASRVYDNDAGRLVPAWSTTDGAVTALGWGDADGDGAAELALGGADGLRVLDGAGRELAAAAEPVTALGWGDADGDGAAELALGGPTGVRVVALGAGGLEPLAAAATEAPVAALAWKEGAGGAAAELALGLAGGRDRVVALSADGELAERWVAAQPDATRALGWGDWDGDGRVDLAVGGDGAPARVLRGRGDGGYETAWVAARPGGVRALAWGDWDGDGDVDLAVVDADGASRLYANHGGTLRAGWTTAASGAGHAVAWGDVDGDGDLDLAVGSDGAEPTRLYRNREGRLEPDWSAATAEPARALAWGDVDGDGDLDLAAGGRIDRLYVNVDGTLAAAWRAPEPGATRALAWGDWDGDGDLDLAVADADGADRLYANVGGTLAAAWRAPVAESSRALAWGDADGDGRLELAVAGAGFVRVLARRGAALVPVATLRDGGLHEAVAWADADGDGRLELAVGDGRGADVLYALDAARLVPRWRGPVEARTTALAWSDWNGDGALDLAAGYADAADRVYANVGGTLVEAWTAPAAEPTWSLAWGDADDDGDVDLVTGGAPGASRLWMNGRAAAAKAAVRPLRVRRPGRTAAAFFFSSAERLDSPVAVPYALVGAAGSRAARVVAEYSPSGGGLWLPATAAPGAAPTTALAAAPDGVEHVFLWDAAADGARGDSVVLRLSVLPAELTSPISIALAAASSPPFRLAPAAASSSTAAGPAEADLGIAIADAPDPIERDAPLTYTVTVTNAGPDTATATTLTATLPEGFASTSTVPTQGSCSAQAGTVTCALDTVAPGAAATVFLVGTPTAGGTIALAAEVSAAETDPDPSDDAAEEETTVVEVALAVIQSDAPDPVGIGAPLTYAVTVTNGGPSTATEVVLTDTLPVGSTLVSTTPSQGSCTDAGGVVTCTLGSVGAAASATVDVAVTAPTSAGTITNTATVAAAEPEADPSDDTSAESTAVVAADVAVTKLAEPDPVGAGEELIYTLTVTNDGPSTATEVTLTDTLPTEVGFVAATPEQGSCSELANVVTCALGGLAADAQSTVVVRVTAPDAATTLTNTATVAALEPDPDPSDDTATVDTEVVLADLALSKTADREPVGVGEELTYTLTVTNDGPSTATEVTLTDTLPAELTFVDAAASQGSCSETDGAVSCALDALAAGAAATVELTVTAPDAPAELTNVASVAAAEPDPQPDDDQASVTTTVVAVDLTLTKTDTVDPVEAGAALGYTLTVNNDGPSTATDVVVVDTLPAGAGFVAASPSQGSCSAAAGVVTCTLGTLEVGATATVELDVTAPGDPGTVTNTATVSSREPDLDPDGDAASAETTVTALADVAVTQSDAPDPIEVGETLTYTIEVANDGPSAATGVVLTDTVPPGVLLSSEATRQGRHDADRGTFTVELGRLEAGARRTLSFDAIPIEPGPITNTVTVEAAEPDPEPGNDTSAESTSVLPFVDVALTMSDDVDPVDAGQSWSYTLSVTNAGPSAATEVVAVDTLPADVEVVATSASQGTVTVGASEVTVELGTIAADAAATATITLVAVAGGVRTNTASVTSAELDVDAQNDVATETTTVVAVADLGVTQSDAPDPVDVEQPLLYTVRVTNAGPSSATAATLTDTLPEGVRFDAATPSRGTCTETDGTVTCALGALAADEEATVDVAVTPLAAGTLTNEARVGGDERDPDPDDDVAVETTTVAPVADLALSQSAAPDPAVVGATLTYSVEVRNDGPSPATGLVVTDTLPDAATFVSAAAAGSCAEADGVVTCTLDALDPLAVGASTTVTVEVVPTTAGTVTNAASVAGAQTDPEPSNDASTLETTVVARADLRVTKLDDPDPVEPGARLTYTVEVTNDGPSTAADVVAVDVLPADVAFVAAEPSDGSCSEEAGTVTCSLGELAAAATATITISVDAGDAGEITNTVSVSSATEDPDPSDDEASATTSVLPPLALAVEAACLAGCPGSTIVYQLTGENTTSATATVAVELVEPSAVPLASFAVAPGPIDLRKGIVLPPTQPATCPQDLTFTATLTDALGREESVSFTVPTIALDP